MEIGPNEILNRMNLNAKNSLKQIFDETITKTINDLR